ncbi:MAG: TetR family transcriptional regulator [Actinomycetota bacterium]
MPSLRERNRHAAMRLTQRTALDLFEEQGFDNVTVNQIAEEVGMAASTIYRHFDTKEAIVLWDEHDADLEQPFDQAFRALPPFEALRSVLVEELGRRYDGDEFQLRRVRYLYATEQLHAASVESSYADAEELAEALEQVLSKTNRGAALVMAGAAMIALDVAFDRWQESGASKPLGALIDEAFGALGNLESLR